MSKTKETATPQTIEGLQALVSEQNETIEKQNETISEQNELLTEQAKTIAKLEKKVEVGETKPSVEIDGKSYLITCGVRHGGKNLKPAEVAQNEALCKELLAIDGQNILIEEV